MPDWSSEPPRQTIADYLASQPARVNHHGPVVLRDQKRNLRMTNQLLGADRRAGVIELGRRRIVILDEFEFLRRAGRDR